MRILTHDAVQEMNVVLSLPRAPRIYPAYNQGTGIANPSFSQPARLAASPKEVAVITGAVINLAKHNEARDVVVTRAENRRVKPAGFNHVIM